MPGRVTLTLFGATASHSSVAVLRMQSSSSEARAADDSGLTVGIAASVGAFTRAEWDGFAGTTRGDPAGYQSHLLYAEPDGTFSVSAMVWLPG